MSEPRSEHLTPMEVASYVDGVASEDARRRLDAHLADCVECRDEVVDARRIVASRIATRRSIARLWLPAAVAATLVFVLIRPPSVDQRGEHREAPVTTTVLPRAIVPIGTVDSLPVLQWTSVPNANRYQVRLFNADGTVLWDEVTDDTTARVPATVDLRSGTTYYWKVDAQTGFGRQAASELIEFSVRYPRRR